MIRLFYYAVCVSAVACTASCTGSNDRKDRTDVLRLFSEIVALTENYTKRISAAPDSATWVETSMQFEDRLEKINFSFPADTDLLLSEGQNDTISRLINAYVKVRDERLNVLLHPVSPSDSITTDSVEYASRSLGS